MTLEKAQYAVGWSAENVLLEAVSEAELATIYSVAVFD